MKSDSKPRLNTLKPRISYQQKALRVSIESGQRITGNKWVTIKKRYERENPRLCAECNRQGLVGNGDQLDHIIPLWAGGTNTESNYQWLCIEHHKEKTNNEANLRNQALQPF